MITELLYWMIRMIAKWHDELLKINDYTSIPLDDKQLHFVVIGAIGLIMIFVIYPIFKLLAKTNHTMVIAWIYVFTLLIVLTFAIEIGQGFSGTGAMEMADVVYGLGGFLCMFAVFSVIRGIYHIILELVKSAFKKS